MSKKIALMVAEKPSVAKAVATLLSNKANKPVRSIFSKSKYNPVFEFEYMPIINNPNPLLRVTSVSGHFMAIEFPEIYQNWNINAIKELFKTQINKNVIPQSSFTLQNILYHSKNADQLILWTDCDREGEAIGYDIIDQYISGKNQINPLDQIDSQIFRANFSALTQSDIVKAMENLGRPNKCLSDAVKVRQEVDLRTGAAFTRFQTLSLGPILGPNNKQVLSYGPCQFPTLGFVIQRHFDILNFQSQPFWNLKLDVLEESFLKNGNPKKSKLKIEFTWQGEKLFDRDQCQNLFVQCANQPAKVIEIENKEAYKRRPIPLNTVEAQKIISRKLKINSSKCMEIMESLYNRGFISYPRTETNKFNPSINLFQIVQQLSKDSSNEENLGIGYYANKLLNKELKLFGGPREGNKDDKAHPPIYPVKLASKKDFEKKEELQIYLFLVKHFLALVSRDAVGQEKTIKLQLGNQLFQSQSMQIKEKNYLEIYDIENWNEKIFPFELLEGQELNNLNLKVHEGKTSAPSALTEADLIQMMDENGIGTDATISEHIKNIQLRGYAQKQGINLVPTQLGLSIYESYKSVNKEALMFDPQLRSKMEKDLKNICDGLKSPETVLQETLSEMTNVYDSTLECKQQIQIKFALLMGNSTFQPDLSTEQQIGINMGTQAYIQQQNLKQISENSHFMKCLECEVNNMQIKSNKRNELFIACDGFPRCKNTYSFFKKGITKIEIQKDDKCASCCLTYQKPVHRALLGFDEYFANQLKEVDENVYNLLDNKQQIICCLNPKCASQNEIFENESQQKTTKCQILIQKINKIKIQ